MPVGVRITIESEGIDAELRQLKEGLADRTEMNVRVGQRAQLLTQTHLGAIAESRHTTAESLGASPTGFWAQAVEKTTSAADETGATVTIDQPGIGRAAHDVTITPISGKYLTIPAIAAAYGKRAATVPDLTVMIRWKDGERRAVALIQAEAAATGAGTPSSRGPRAAQLQTVWYWLVKSVFQPQDPTLLPTDDEYQTAALSGIRDYVDVLLAR